MAGVNPRKKKRKRMEGDLGAVVLFEGVLRESLWISQPVFFALQF